MALPVHHIEREELRAKLERKDAFKLVMAASEFGFRSKHIPGSVRFPAQDQMFAALGPDEDIVVYCSNADCHASLQVVAALQDRGYRNVRHYVGGLVDWENADLPLEGDWAPSTTA
jgi:rhodanese-related sulfurtransferase